MFTEQKEKVHLVDARTFEKTQVLSVGEGDNVSKEIDLGGASFAPDGKSVIVGSERAMWQWVSSSSPLSNPPPVTVLTIIGN